ncbi:hypothetical protein H4N54_01960 [Limnospira fusiformis KN01]|uniref:Uncharacterized protein n=2 Tax=Limnospira TaxID=2596745 RepID=A0A9P1KK82_9CYAN|nr:MULTISPECIES: hypothetical protein [Limnospira]EKD09498.1 hypothetical protein SPLC1_S209030 [Arthrospira platensis C1]QJB24855.1 hypothetical protein HFV01_02345 [Limnospira fusiformis SAG 85.79]QNH57133.1 MAG: hypothetical protein H2674_23890 [Limnospira indica BM01]ULB46188.1 hypothetical protein H4N54_01960 [Limnospira fusiformis KN01]CDM97772.1 conserved protein of unknown function [Limnospira indica PCC 8005]
MFYGVGAGVGSWLVFPVADLAPWGRVYQADLWELWLTAEPAPTHPGAGVYSWLVFPDGGSSTLGAGLSS